MNPQDSLRVALAQIAPIWLDRVATIEKVCARIVEAAAEGAALVCFGEALLPGYPFWVELTDGARFESARQKKLYSHYVREAVSIRDGDLDAVCETCKSAAIACYVGIIERASDRSGHSLHASLVYIDTNGRIGSVHRKLVPTYEERLVWSPGDGNGLRTHKLGAFTLGGLNCWENWMPLSRAALYAQGEDLHVAVWPGSQRNTDGISMFIARESRSYVISVSGLMRPDDVASIAPEADTLRELLPEFAANGGSTVVAPDGEVLVAPRCNQECLLFCDFDHARVRQERQNFDPAGHYSRPDVVRVEVDRRRQSIASFIDDD